MNGYIFNPLTGAFDRKTGEVKRDVYSPDFGFLYNYYAATHPKLPASGWRLPTLSEYEAMIQAHSESGNVPEQFMTSNPNYWQAGFLPKTNELNFSVKGAGSRYNIFDNLKTGALLWLKDDDDIPYYCWFAINNNVGLYDATTEEYAGASIRLIRELEYIAPNGTIVKSGYTGNDGKKYDCVVIENRLWLLDNLAETQYSNGSLIRVVEDNDEWKNISSDKNAEAFIKLGDDSKLKVIGIGDLEGENGNGVKIIIERTNNDTELNSITYDNQTKELLIQFDSDTFGMPVDIYSDLVENLIIVNYSNLFDTDLLDVSLVDDGIYILSGGYSGMPLSASARCSYNNDDYIGAKRHTNTMLFEFLSQEAYNTLLENNEINDNTLYFIINAND